MTGIGLSRDELLGGMPARRASTIVFAIENLTQQLVARSRRALTRYRPADTATDRERQFIDAVASARDGQVRPDIQDVERYATEWAPLVPDVPDIRAAVLHHLSTRYTLDHDRVPKIRFALAADSDAVADSYRRQQSHEIADAYKPTREARQRFKWFRSRFSERLETMPPFWMAFSLTLTETVGGGMLALPIALAGLGVPASLLLLVVFGVVNIVTVAALVEGITRDGTMRYGSGYFGQLVANRLGRPGRIGIVTAMFAVDATGLLVALIGLGTTLSGSTGISALLWVGLFFVLALVVIRRENLNATIAAALVVGIAIIAIAIALIALGMLHVQPELLTATGGFAAGGTSVIALVFGVLLYVYFGHTSAGNAARQVLRRDPSGRTLLWGNVTAMVVAAVIYSLFVIAVNGSVPADRLASETGTALTPLAEVAGPAVGALGSIYVILSLGMGAVFMSLGLYLQAGEQVKQFVGTSKPLRSFLAFLVPAAIFAIVEAMLFFGAGSFTEPLSLVGALALPLLGGVFPMLILAAARHRGERVPGTSLRWLGSPLVVAIVITLYVGGVVAYALFVWTNPVERLLAIATALAIAALIVVSVRRGSFKPRTVVELRADEPPGAGMDVAVVSDGRAFAPGTARLPDVNSVSSITAALPTDRPPEVDVWAHRPTRDGESEDLRVSADVEPTEVVVKPVGRWLPS